MRIAEVVAKLNDVDKLDVNQTQIRYQIRIGKLARPVLDRSRNFHFTDEHVQKLRELLAQPAELSPA